MQVKLILFVFFLAFLSFGCQKDDYNNTKTFFLEYGFEIPAGLSVFQVHKQAIPNISHPLNSLILSQGKTLSDVASITPRATTWQIISGNNFQFLQFGSLSIDDFQKESLPPIEIFYTLDFLNNNSDRQELIPGLANSLNYFSESQIDFIAEYKLNSITSSFIEVEGITTFDVTFK